MSSDLDGGWKDALDYFLERCLALLYPEIHADIDWSEEVHWLEQEFRNPVPHAELADVVCDKLVRVVLQEDGQEVYLHAEAQCQVRPTFPRRVWVYNHLAGLRYLSSVISLAILGDDDPDWRPSSYYQGRWGARSGLDFLPVKLLDFIGREDELEAHQNVAGLILLAHLLARQTRDDPVARRAARLRLLRAVRRREQLDHEERQRLIGIVERFIDLPRDVEDEVRCEFRQESEEVNMPYVTSFERIARSEGREEGQEEGCERGLRLGLRTVVELRFGEPDAAFLALLDAADLPQLEHALNQARFVKSLDELRALLAPLETA